MTGWGQWNMTETQTLVNAFRYNQEKQSKTLTSGLEALQRDPRELARYGEVEEEEEDDEEEESEEGGEEDLSAPGGMM